WSTAGSAATRRRTSRPWSCRRRTRRSARCTASGCTSGRAPSCSTPPHHPTAPAGPGSRPTAWTSAPTWPTASTWPAGTSRCRASGGAAPSRSPGTRRCAGPVPMALRRPPRPAARPSWCGRWPRRSRWAGWRSRAAPAWPAPPARTTWSPRSWPGWTAATTACGPYGRRTPTPSGSPAAPRPRWPPSWPAWSAPRRGA
ncbi:MAG: hypothetical protein AVDCRST_MAG41-4370, partial [uncultured Corynebacteriales bacterium]